MPAVFICDIKGSRKIKDWPNILLNSRQILNDLNQKFQDIMLVNFAFTVGDEFQGVTTQPSRVYDILSYLKIYMPANFYCGIGLGDIEINLPDKTGMRGEGFYRAREALNVCKGQRRQALVISGSGFFDKTVNSILFLIESIERTWTKRQKEIANFYRIHPELTYEEIGKHFSVSKQNIYKILRSSLYEAVKDGISTLKMLFDYVNQNRFTL